MTNTFNGKIRITFFCGTCFHGVLMNEQIVCYYAKPSVKLFFY